MSDLGSKNELINELEQAVHKFTKSAAQCDDYDDLQENITNESNNSNSNSDSDSDSDSEEQSKECNNGTGSCSGTRSRVVVGE